MRAFHYRDGYGVLLLVLQIRQKTRDYLIRALNDYHGRDLHLLLKLNDSYVLSDADLLLDYEAFTPYCQSLITPIPMHGLPLQGSR